MTTKIFNLIDSINREGIDNTAWMLWEMDQYGTRQVFGTDENVMIKGKVLALCVEPNDTYSFIRTETADYFLTIKNENTPFPTALCIWKLD